MFDYYVRKLDFGWFMNDNRRRPLPPLYKRPRWSQEQPTLRSPIGNITAPDELQKLTDEQVKIWFSS